MYRLNWSPLAKSLNTGGVVGLALLGATEAALLLVVAIGGIKVWSITQVHRMLHTGAGTAP